MLTIAICRILARRHYSRVNLLKSGRAQGPGHRMTTGAGRKVLVGVTVGVLASAVVIGADLLLTRISAGGVQPLQAIEFRTYDWRLSRTARPETARRDIALIEIDEYSLRNLQPNVG